MTPASPAPPSDPASAVVVLPLSPLPLLESSPVLTSPCEESNVPPSVTLPSPAVSGPSAAPPSLGDPALKPPDELEQPSRLAVATASAARSRMNVDLTTNVYDRYGTAAARPHRGTS